MNLYHSITDLFHARNRFKLNDQFFYFRFVRELDLGFIERIAIVFRIVGMEAQDADMVSRDHCGDILDESDAVFDDKLQLAMRGAFYALH